METDRLILALLGFCLDLGGLSLALILSQEIPVVNKNYKK
jgi:hypothetical protein